MPGGDRTGPAGMGPMTGRAAGYCSGYPASGYVGPVRGQGFFQRGGFTPNAGTGFAGVLWRGRGFRFGRRRGFGFGRGRGPRAW